MFTRGHPRNQSEVHSWYIMETFLDWIIHIPVFGTGSIIAIWSSLSSSVDQSAAPLLPQISTSTCSYSWSASLLKLILDDERAKVRRRWRTDENPFQCVTRVSHEGLILSNIKERILQMRSHINISNLTRASQEGTILPNIIECILV